MIGYEIISWVLNVILGQYNISLWPVWSLYPGYILLSVQYCINFFINICCNEALI